MANARRATEVHLTIANLGADWGQRVPHYAIPLDLPRLFKWEPGDADYADGWAVHGHSGGYAGRWHLVREDDRGDDLTDAAATIYLSGKPIRYLPISTLSVNRILTISEKADSDSNAADCVAGDRLTITRLDVEAFTLQIDDNASSTTLITLPASEAWFVDLRFDGTNWALLRAGKMTP